MLKPNNNHRHLILVLHANVQSFALNVKLAMLIANKIIRQFSMQHYRTNNFSYKILIVNNILSNIQSLMRKTELPFVKSVINQGLIQKMYCKMLRSKRMKFTTRLMYKMNEWRQLKDILGASRSCIQSNAIYLLAKLQQILKLCKWFLNRKNSR